MEWIKTNLWELRQSTALKHFGVVLALTHVLTYVFWPSAELIRSFQEPLCWNFLPNCSNYVLFEAAQLPSLMNVYLGASALAAIGFISSRFYSVGWFMLTLALIIKFYLYILDYRLSSNIHAILFIINFVYLFIPQKIKLTRLLIISSYLALGAIKLNNEWFSGFWVQDKIPQLPQKGAEWWAAVSVAIELGAPLWLMARSRKPFLIAFFTLIGFHILQIAFINTLEPAVFIGLLFFFVFVRFEDRRLETEYLYQSYIRPEASRIWIPLVLTSFWAIQILPLVKNLDLQRLKLPVQVTSPSLPRQCEQQSYVVFENRMQEIELNTSSVAEEFRCHPYLRFQAAKTLCQQYASDPQFKNVSSYFISRTLAEKSYKRVFGSDDICQTEFDFKKWGQGS